MTDGAVARPAHSPRCGPGERVSRIIGQSPADSRTDLRLHTHQFPLRLHEWRLPVRLADLEINTERGRTRAEAPIRIAIDTWFMLRYTKQK